MSELSATKAGVAAYCTVCHQMKQPRGRSGSLAAYYCDNDCPGYNADPQVGGLWPNETEAAFGYPVGDVGTTEVPR